MLEPKAGYIPVYIRLGDQPLSEINPILAEAFREHGISARNIKDVSSIKPYTQVHIYICIYIL